MQRLALPLVVLVLLALGVWVWSRSGTLTAVEPAGEDTVSAIGKADLVAPSTSPSPEGASATSAGSRVEAVEATPQEAPLRGLLLDRETGEPVPWYELRVALRGAQVCRVETDAEGRFETPIAYPAGTLQLSLEDVEGQESSNSSADLFLRIEHDPAAPEQELRIGVGPTYSFELALPPGTRTGDLRARLYIDPPEHRDSDRNFHGMGQSHWMTVLRAAREDPGPWWVRFRKSRMPGWAVWLSVDSLDGLWRGGTRVAGGPGIHPDVARIEMRPRCAVRGRFVAQAPLDRGGAQIALFRQGEEGQPLVWTYADDEDGFRIADLDPAVYRLEVRDEAFRAPPARFTLTEGELDLGELPWEPIPLAGPVRLRLRSAVEVPIDVQLVRSTDPPRHPLWHSDSWEELPEGGYESLFEWEEVYAGEYAIEVHGHGDVSWSLPLGHVEPPADDLVLELPVPADPLRFEVRAEDGAELTGWELWVRGEEAWELVEHEDGRLTSLLLEEGFRWAVWSPGHRARSAGLGNATWPGQGERTVHVSLQPGWSRLFDVRNRAGWDPVPGAEVWLDGALAGVTDPRGELLVARDAAPVDWEVRHPTLVWSESGPTLGGRGLHRFVVHVHLRPQ